jgi:hypothetical protein
MILGEQTLRHTNPAGRNTLLPPSGNSAVEIEKCLQHESESVFDTVIFQTEQNNRLLRERKSWRQRKSRAWRGLLLRAKTLAIYMYYTAYLPAGGQCRGTHVVQITRETSRCPYCAFGRPLNLKTFGVTKCQNV